jgi:hypothetical protein
MTLLTEAPVPDLYTFKVVTPKLAEPRTMTGVVLHLPLVRGLIQPRTARGLEGRGSCAVRLLPFSPTRSVPLGRTARSMKGD